MKTWLVAGPFPVSTDTLKPGNALQEKVFKTDIIACECNSGKPVPPVWSIKKILNGSLFL